MADEKSENLEDLFSFTDVIKQRYAGNGSIKPIPAGTNPRHARETDISDSDKPPTDDEFPSD